MPKDLLNYLKKVWISGKQIKISLADGGSQHEERAQPKRDKKRPK